MKKGMLITTNMLIGIIFIVVAILLIFLLWGTFSSELGNPVSNIFYQVLDWMGNLLFSR